MSAWPEVDGVDAEQAGRGQRAPRVVGVLDVAPALGVRQAVGGELLDQVRPLGDVHERALAQRVGDARRVEVAQELGGHPVAHLGLAARGAPA